MSQLENLVALLLMVSTDQSTEEEACISVYHRLMAHHKEYYTSKWTDATNEEVLAFFSSIWLSPLEKSYSWFTDWRPTVAFQLVHTLMRKSSIPKDDGGTNLASLASLSDEQLKKIEHLEPKITADEERVEKEMERHNMYVASWKMLQLIEFEREAKVQGDPTALRQVNEMIKSARKGMVGGSVKVVKMANCVRRETLKGVLDVLTPIQREDLLATTSMLQVQIRKWGKQRAEAQMKKLEETWMI
ncbi:hypothetical protein PHJA_000435900 [Phtheirospermum japonicum]|uniref:DOG1 domain-containing protein n=1 Tax=Phtheirospermum japonicum TaxID=374723 RepID=A0A830BCU4_9LAMI|nr:hypothetical protein PHJA_000435900 [Phtheirospermum japonicum]